LAELRFYSGEECMDSQIDRKLFEDNLREEMMNIIDKNYIK
jgi:hypothetical protein